MKYSASLSSSPQESQTLQTEWELCVVSGREVEQNGDSVSWDRRADPRTLFPNLVRRSYTESVKR